MKLLSSILTLMILVSLPAQSSPLSEQTKHSRLVIISNDGQTEKSLKESDDNMEAPNWDPHNKFLVYNLKNGLYKISLYI